MKTSFVEGGRMTVGARWYGRPQMVAPLEWSLSNWKTEQEKLTILKETSSCAVEGESIHTRERSTGRDCAWRREQERI